MKPNFSIPIRLLAVIILLTCSYSTSRSAATVQFPDGKPCVDNTIVIEEQVDAPARLSIQKATCGDFHSNVDLLLENLTAKHISGYEISHIQDYEQKRGVLSSQTRRGVEVKPGESVKINFNGGFRDGNSYGKPVGLIKRDTYRIKWIEFSDGSQWGQVPTTVQEEPPGHDLKLRDDNEPFVVAFQYEIKSFSIMSCDDYGF
jgi:hypothetical protein